MFKTLIMILGIPPALGTFVNLKLRKFTAARSNPKRIFSIVTFLGMIGIMFHSNYDFFLQFIKYIFALVLIYKLLALTTGFSFATIMRVSPFERRAITIETGIQNSALSLTLLYNVWFKNGQNMVDNSIAERKSRIIPILGN